MPLLRLTQTAQGGDAYHVEIALEGERLARQTATSHFSFALTPQDQADLRWYLEDYLQWPQDPAPQIAARVEERMVELGTDLFKSIFQANDDARELWSAARHDLASTRVEIVTEIDAATALPWELLREPRTATHLALHACSFVRAQPTAARRPRILTNESGPVRILLVICRPAGSTDVPFRSVAARIVKSLNDTAREAFDLDVLRPPTFEQLARELRRAKSEGRPYHVVHFDGFPVGDGVGMERGGAAGARSFLTRRARDPDASTRLGHRPLTDPTKRDPPLTCPSGQRAKKESIPLGIHGKPHPIQDAGISDNRGTPPIR